MAEIVRLTAANASLLQHLAPDVFDEAIQPAYLKAFLDDARHVMMLAVEAGRVVGMASAVEYFHPDKPPQLWINEIGVSPAFQRSGIGRALTLALIEEAEARGCVYAWLGTDRDNVSGNACFSRVPGGDPPEAFNLFAWDLED